MNTSSTGDRRIDPSGSASSGSASSGSASSGSASSGSASSGSASPGSGSVGSRAAGDERVEQRAADLLPEERAAGSADPEAQAEAILAESDEREAGLTPVREPRTSEQTGTPGDATR